MIREATNGFLDWEDILPSLDCHDQRYPRPRIKNKGKYGFQKVLVTKILSLDTFAMYRIVSPYDELKRSTKEYETGAGAIKLNATSTQDPEIEWYNNHEINWGKLLVLPDAKD